MRRQAIALAIGLFIGAACATVAQTEKPSHIQSFQDGAVKCYWSTSFYGSVISCVRVN